MLAAHSLQGSLEKMTIGSHELALTIINDGKGYEERCDIARGTSPSYKAYRWLRVAQAGAVAYQREFGSPGTPCFTGEDILLAAAELFEYYAEHIAECDAAA
jgi:hypothetical protein